MTDKITYLNDWKRKKKIDEELARGRKPLYVSHLDGKIYGSPNKHGKPEEFGTRVARIKSSLERINRLMNELKALSENERNNDERRK